MLWRLEVDSILKKKAKYLDITYINVVPRMLLAHVILKNAEKLMTPVRMVQ